MNNRFRFRVFDKEKNNYVDDSEVELILHNDGVLLFGDWHEDIKVVEQDKYIIEQCTGLRDKNGNLIYEGDIVKSMIRTGYIKWNKGDMTWFVYVLKSNEIIALNGYLDDELEIIGNIHEQAEQGRTK